jgi:small-conductance mechanosensitive channel
MATKSELIQQEVGKIKDVTMGPLKQASMTISNYLPQIIGAVTLLAGGWLAAVVLRKVAGKGLRALGFDVLLERLGVTGVLRRGGIHQRPSELVGWLLYWLVLFSTLVGTFNVLGLAIATVLLKSIAAYIPHLLIALFLLGLGFFASRYIDAMTTAAAYTFELPFPHVLGRAAQALIVFITIVIALSELGVGARIINFSFLGLLAVAGMAAAIAFGLGARRLVEQLAAGQGLRQWLHAGDIIQYDRYDGAVVSVGPTHVHLRTEAGIVAIPNTVMLGATIVKTARETPSGAAKASSIHHLIP